METPARGLLRWARSAALAVTTVGLAASAHSAAGGDIPSGAALMVLTLLTVLACVLLTGRRRGVVSILAAMTLLQVLLHAGFMLAAPMRCVDSGSAIPSPLHPTMHAVVPTALTACATQGSAAGAWHVSPAMLTAHGIATLLLAFALACGERALWRLRGVVLPLLPHPSPVAADQAARPVLSSQIVLPSLWTSVSPLVRRGPPAAATAVPC